MNKFAALVRASQGNRILRTCLTLLALLISGFAFGQTVPSQWDSNTIYTFGDEVLYNGNTYKCTGYETANNHPSPLTEAFDQYGILVWELYNVDSSVNVTVGPGQQFDTFQNAWKYVKDAIIAQGNPASTISILIGSNGNSYSENFPSSFTLDHPYGAQLYIYGLGTVTFNFNGSDGLIVDKGHTLALLSGVTIANTGAAGSALGLLSLDGSTVSVQNLTIRGFSCALDAERHSELFTNGSMSIPSFTGNAVQSKYKSLVYVNKAFSISPSSPGTNGFYANAGSDIFADGCTVNNLIGAAFFAFGGSHISAIGATATNVQYGFLARRQSIIEADSSVANSCSAAGWTAVAGGYITNASASGDGTITWDAHSYVDASGQ